VRRGGCMAWQRPNGVNVTELFQDQIRLSTTQPMSN
jgi:hypothetical protein